jgi:S1-C subfamily serine protease
MAYDKANDLALLRSEAVPEKVARLRPSVRLGEPVAAFGFPLAGVLSLSGTFTQGGISALAGMRDDSRYLQVSVPVQPGNSGGPLLDERGNVVGVVTSKLNALRMMALTGGDIAQNVNFAIKSSVALAFLEANGVSGTGAGASGLTGVAMTAPDLAEHGQALSAFIQCTKVEQPVVVAPEPRVPRSVPPAMQLPRPASRPQTTQEACAADVRSYCASVRPSPGNPVAACMRENASRLSPACTAAIQRLQQQRSGARSL